jgi:hypothetical protein
MDALTITLPQLVEAYRQWEQDLRDGKTRSYAETAALPIEQVARECAESMWERLSPK